MSEPRVLTVFVPGTPVAQGSKRHVGNGRMIESATGLGDWRARVVFYVADMRRRTEHPGYPRPAAVDVVASFTLDRPASVRREHPTVKPDLDKLIRAVFDALTESKIVDDDAQIVRVLSVKRYGERPGVLIHVRERNPR
jgi:crossover junction endodeoxyribonuclease RusA